MFFFRYRKARNFAHPMASAPNQGNVVTDGSRQQRNRRKRGNGNKRGRQTSRNVQFGFGSLRKLREKDPDDIVLDLASERCLPAFRSLLAKTDMTDEMIELVLEVLVRACACNSPEYFNKLLIELPKSLYVILSLKGYITRLCGQGDSNGNVQLFIERTIKLFTEILKKIPSAFDSLPLGDLEKVVRVLAASGKIDNDVIVNVEQLKVIEQESLEKEMRKRNLEKQRKTRCRVPG